MALKTLLFLFIAILLVTTMVSADEFEDEKAKKLKAPTLQSPPPPVQEVFGDEKYGVLTGWQKFIGDIGNQAKNITQDIGNQAGDAINNAKKNITENIGNQAGDAINNAKKNITNQMGDAINNAKKNLTNQIGKRIGNTGKKPVDKTRKFFKDFYGTDSDEPSP